MCDETEIARDHAVGSWLGSLKNRQSRETQVEMNSNSVRLKEDVPAQPQYSSKEVPIRISLEASLQLGSCLKSLTRSESLSSYSLGL